MKREMLGPWVELALVERAWLDGVNYLVCPTKVIGANHVAPMIDGGTDLGSDLLDQETTSAAAGSAGVSCCSVTPGSTGSVTP